MKLLTHPKREAQQLEWHLFSTTVKFVCNVSLFAYKSLLRSRFTDLSYLSILKVIVYAYLPITFAMVFFIIEHLYIAGWGRLAAYLAESYYSLYYDRCGRACHQNIENTLTHTGPSSPTQEHRAYCVPSCRRGFFLSGSWTDYNTFLYPFLFFSSSSWFFIFPLPTSPGRTPQP